MRVGITSLFRDEARFLKEYIEFHKLVGIDVLYLQNNLSEDDYMSVLAPYIASGFVVLQQVTDNRAFTDGGMIFHVQNLAFDWAVNQAEKDGLDWLGLFNLDEFLYPIQERNIKNVLDKFGDNVGQIGINWQMFGHSNKVVAPGELITEHLILTQETDIENRHVKPMVRPKAVKECTNPHYVTLYPEYISVNTHGQLREISDVWPAWDLNIEYHVGPFDIPVRKDVMLLNHYTMRDLSFCEQKCQWYRQFGYGEDFIQWCKNRANDKENTVIHRFLPELKERMNGQH